MYCLFLVDLIFVAAMLSFVKGYPIETAIMDSNKKASGIMSAAPTSTHLKSLIKFLQRSPSTFHAVEESCQYLLSQGFKALDESTIWHFGFQDIEIDSTEDSWIVPGGKYFLKRQGSSLLAFTVGKNFNPALGLSGDSSNYFKIIAAHTDSPCLKVRPNPKKVKEGYEMLGVSTYGGGLWHTWFDRDLSLAGRVFVFNNSTKKTEERLVDFEESLLRVPNLAIHLDRSVNEGFKFNTELHLAPILSNCVANDLDNSSIYSLIQEKLGLSSHEEIIELELSLYDTQGPVVSGLGKEFLHSARLDNLLMSFTALASLSESEGIEEETGVRIICLFDHEEVGSQSAVGADSNFLMEILGRLFDGKRGLEVALKKSFLVSADVAHAIHPNYGDKHEPNHAPRMNQGLVIKFNPNQRYMTNGLSAAYFKSLSKELLEEQNKSSVKKFVGCQDFIVKNDSPCGSTIGPFLASKTGILTIDVGIPVLSMHSIREMMGVDDLDTTIMLFKKFFTKPL